MGTDGRLRMWVEVHTSSLPTGYTGGKSWRGSRFWAVPRELSDADRDRRADEGLKNDLAAECDRLRDLFTEFFPTWTPTHPLNLTRL